MGEFLFAHIRWPMPYFPPDHSRPPLCHKFVQLRFWSMVFGRFYVQVLGRKITIVVTTKSTPPPIFNELSDSNINLKELWPVVAGIKCWGKCWSGKYVLLHTDNTQVVSMIASGRSKNAQAVCLLRKLFWICVIYKIDLRAFYINTSDNVLADKLSRLSPDVQKPHFGMPVKFMFCCSQGLSSH